MTGSNDKQQRWNQKYRDKEFSVAKPVFVLEANQQLLVGGGLALDVASGFGSNAVFLAKKNYHVDAIDYSAVATEKLATYSTENNLPVNAQCADLETFPDLGINRYDVIVGSYYLQRSLFSELFKALKPGGLLFYQTFSGKPENGGPENPAFRLQQGELLTLCREHSILFYREDNGRCLGASCFNDEAMVVVSKSMS